MFTKKPATKANYQAGPTSISNEFMDEVELKLLQKLNGYKGSDGNIQNWRSVIARGIQNGLKKEQNRKGVFSTSYWGPHAFDKFIDRVKQAVTVFENRQKISLKEYNELLEKKKKTELNVSEIERMEELYKRLYSYGLVEYMPKEFFETNIEEKIDELIKVVEKYIDKK